MEIDALKKQISEGKIQDVMDSLIQNIDEDFLNDIIIINSRYSTIEIQNARGVIGIQDYLTERNKITESLLKIIKSFEVNSKSEKTKVINSNWKIKWIKERYPESFIKENNELPKIREFANCHLDYRVILPEKFQIRDKYPYTGEVGINFIDYKDDEKISMSISLGINLILLGDMNLFILAVLFPETSDISVYDKYNQIQNEASKLYNWEKVKQWFNVEIIQTNRK